MSTPKVPSVKQSSSKMYMLIKKCRIP
jgi:hypothetical protein